MKRISSGIYTGKTYDEVRSLVRSWFAASKTKHTPGPWIAEPEEASEHRGIAITAPANGWIVATILPDDGRTADDVDWANAHILASSPQLLATVKENLLVFKGLEMAYPGEFRDSIARCEAAISGAEIRT